MVHRLTNRIYFGNWTAPFEVTNPGGVINVAHHFNPGRGRDAYFAMLGRLPWDCLYFRIARKDRQEFDHIQATLVERAYRSVIERSDRPIVVHCQMGGHRGPATALFCAWLEVRKKDFDQWHAKVLQMVPGLARGRNYYQSMLSYCKARCLK